MMRLDRKWWQAFACLIILTLHAPDARAAEWRQKTFDVAGGGELTLSYPESWGKEPDYRTVDAGTYLRFGPFGPKEKPVFMVSITAALALDPVSKEQLLAMTREEIDAYKGTAFETKIPIKNLAGPHMTALYFSITDTESKRGEFDYLTMAVIISGRLLVKCQFLSSAGAPNYGADAIRMMKNIQYTAPAPKPEEN